jgi:hypothetical protein
MSSGQDAIGGAPAELRAGALAKVRLHVALIEQKLRGGARAAQEALQGQNHDSPRTWRLRRARRLPCQGGKIGRDPDGQAAGKENPVNTIVKAAALQISPVLHSRQGTVERVVRKIRELGERDVRFTAFPEAVVPDRRGDIARNSEGVHR